MKVYKAICKVFEVLLVAITALQAVLLMASVLFRYVFNSPIVWGDEIVRYSLIWMCFAGCAVATKEKQHIAVDVIDLALPKIAQKITNWIVDLVVIGFMIFMIYYGLKMTNFERGMFGETLPWFSYAYVYASIPFGGFFTIFFTITKYFIKEEEIPKQE